MPRVLVDLLFFTGHKGGMETYVRELYRELGARADGYEYIALASTEFLELDHAWFPGRVVASGISGENRRAWAWGELTAVSAAARELSVDLIHAPANMGPYRAPVPVVVTVHDLLSFRFPRLLGTVNSAFVRLLVRLASRAATVLVTDSNASADDIARYLKPSAPVKVIPLAGAPVTAAVSESGADRLGLPDEIILSTGNRLPHKNFAILLEALAFLAPDKRPHLVITGSRTGDPLIELRSGLGLEQSVTLLGWVTDAELDALWASAKLYVIPSLFEGFGLPVLDAMQRGVPVVASDIPVLREVGGSAPAYVDATRPQDVASAMARVLSDETLRESMVAAGAHRAAEFGWARVARETAAAFRLAMDR
jgi:glycosyltransferase involved in cell wall biosynthesis